MSVAYEIVQAMPEAVRQYQCMCCRAWQPLACALLHGVRTPTKAHTGAAAFVLHVLPTVFVCQLQACQAMHGTTVIDGACDHAEFEVHLMMDKQREHHHQHHLVTHCNGFNRSHCISATDMACNECIRSIGASLRAPEAPQQNGLELLE